MWNPFRRRKPDPEPEPEPEPVDELPAIDNAEAARVLDEALSECRATREAAAVDLEATAEVVGAAAKATTQTLRSIEFRIPPELVRKVIGE